MTKTTRMLALSTMLVCGVFFCGPQGQAQGTGDDYPYCELMQLPKPEVQPAHSTAPGASPTLIQTPLPATAPGAKAMPSIVDLLKNSTDAKEIVNTILSAVAPKKPEEFDQLYAQMYNQIIETYIEPADLSKVGLSAYKSKYNGKINSWSEYSAAIADLFHRVGNRWTYVHSPAENLAAQIGQHENLVDFGANLHRRDDGQFEIEFLDPGSSAQLNGLREGDWITEVNGKRLEGLSKEEAELLLRKSEGDQLKVTSIQDGNSVNGLYTLHEAAADANAVKVELIDNNLVYMKLPSFMNSQEFGQLLDALLNKEKTTPGGLQGMVLDLRYNGGGMVKLAKILIQTFLNDGVVLHEKKRNNREIIDETTSLIPAPEIMKAEMNPAQLAAFAEFKKLPLVILINGSSASAAEIVTGTLQEARPNTVVVGKRSFGKFVEMNIMPTPDCGLAAIMSAMYTTPKGHWLQGLGLTPDIEVNQPRNSKVDAQLAEGVKWLQVKTALNSANVVTMAPDELKILGKVVDKPLEPKISTFSQWQAANSRSITLGGAALALLMIGLMIFYITRPPRPKLEK
jgi:C-terminal peptidase prc